MNEETRQDSCQCCSVYGQVVNGLCDSCRGTIRAGGDGAIRLASILASRVAVMTDRLEEELRHQSAW